MAPNGQFMRPRGSEAASESSSRNVTQVLQLRRARLRGLLSEGNITGATRAWG